MQYSAVQYNKVHCIVVQYSGVQYNEVQCIVVPIGRMWAFAITPHLYAA